MQLLARVPDHCSGFGEPAWRASGRVEDTVFWAGGRSKSGSALVTPLMWMG